MSTHPARAAFDRVERLVGRPLEKASGAQQSSYLIMAFGRTWMFGERRLTDLRSSIVHLWALPSHRDVRVLTAHVVRLQRDVEELQHRIEDRDGMPT